MKDETLDHWRKEIDKVDEELVNVLSKRIKIIEEIGRYKAKQNIAPLQPKRWQDVLQSKMKKAKKLGLSDDLIKEIYETIHKHALELEESMKRK